MRKIQFILALCLFTSLFSCQKEDELVIMQEETTETISTDQSITFHYGSKSVEVDYKIENDEIVLLSELPAELLALRDNKNMYLKAGENGHIWLVDKATAQIAADQRAAFDDMGNFDAFMQSLGLDEINHYAFVVDDKEAGLRSYGEQFDISTYYLPNLKSRKYFDNGVEQPYTANVSFGFSNGNQIEILDVDPNQPDNIFNDGIDNGLHHIAFSVENLEESIALFNDNGYETIITGEFISRSGLVSRLGFLDTRASIGAYTELVEAKLLGFNVSQDEGLLILGLFLGDTKLYCL